MDTQKKDKRNLQGVLNRFENVLAEIKKKGITFGNLNGLLIEDFIDYLQKRSKGEGAKSYYARFKKMLKHAYRKKLMKENILDDVDPKVKGKAKKKDTLTLDEIRILAGTKIESDQIRRAALFCTLTNIAGSVWGGTVYKLTYLVYSALRFQFSISPGRTFFKYPYFGNADC